MTYSRIPSFMISNLLCSNFKLQFSPELPSKHPGHISKHVSMKPLSTLPLPIVLINSREMLIWQYSFLLTRLQHIHSQPDVHEITQHINTIHSFRSLAQSNSDHELLELSYLLEISDALRFNISAINVNNLLSLASNMSSRNPLRQQHLQLSLMRMLLHVLYLTKVGQGHAALAKLKEHHQLMDSEVGSNMRIWDKEGKFNILVCNGERKLYFDWFTQSEAFVFGYILSGAVYFPDSSAEKSLNFFMEGVRVADCTFHL